MNKNYRLVWSEARQAFVVAHEKAKARGKPSHRKAVVRAVAAALLALGEAAFAGGTCPNPSGTTITVSGTVTQTCLLNGSTATSLINQGTISANPEAVSVTGANNTITNSGTISSTGTGIGISRGTVSGVISNSGTISGGTAGIGIYTSVVSGGITNSGTISGAVAGIGIGNDSTVNNGITNSGTLSTIQGGEYGILISASSVSNIVNQGTISSTNFAGIAIIGSTVSSGITNSGTISGSGSLGIGIFEGTVSGGITNSGTISGGIRGIAILNGSTVSGGITNSGAISGGSLGIGIFEGTVSGGITNSGTISGGIRGIGIFSGSTVSGGITNSGTISGGTAGIAIVGSTTTVSNIVNQGTISGGTAGIDLAGSTVSGGITNSGTLSTINGGNYGILIRNGSSVSNIVNQGTISGTNRAGIGIFSGSTVSGGITNSGTISGGATGIRIATGIISGGITNSGTLSTIQGGNYGIVIGNGSSVSSIVNQGTISGGSQVGIDISGSSIVSGGITNSGTLSTIQGGDYGILISASSVSSIVNQGTISGGVTGIGIFSGSTGGITNSGTLSTIRGEYYGILISASSVSSIVNQGTISGTILAGILIGFSTVSGGITNSGTISGGFAGIGIYSDSTVSGGITNSGTISGTNVAGIDIAGSTVSGGITNSGTISGGGVGIDIFNGSTVSGDIVNQGTLSTIQGGNYGILISASSVSNIVNQSTISGGVTGIGIYNGSTVSGGITNSGTISGTNSAGIDIFGSTVSGDIVNSGTLSTIHGEDYGIVITGSSVSNIVNQGTISGTNGAGIAIASHSAVSGGITNSGTLSTINGGNYGIRIGSGSSVSNIVNQGTISGTNFTGIAIFNGSTVSGGITNSGTISGGFTGIYIFDGTVSGGITNSGALSTIHGRDLGISITSGSSVSNIVNQGTISGTILAGILIGFSTVSGGITNSGTLSTIQGGNYGILINSSSSVSSINNQGTISGTNRAGIGIYSDSTVSGGITNSGTISGTNVAGIDIAGSTVSGGITNSGTISGGGVGIDIFNGTVSGGITNSGTIAGGATGIAIANNSTVSGGITNSGTIAGSTYAVFVDSTSSLNSIVIAGNNTAAFAGEVDAPSTPVTVAAGATYTLNNGNFFNVQSFTNAGTLMVGAGSIGTISGTFTNSGTYNEAVASLTSYGELVVHGTANLGGSLLVNVIGAPTLANHTTLSGIIAATTLSGTFATVSTNSSIFTFTPQYTADDLNLVITTASPTPVVNAVIATTPVSAPPPGLGAATVLDELLAAAGCGALSTVCTRLGELTSAQQVSNAVSQMLPLLTGGTTQVTRDTLFDIQQIVQARIASNNGLASGASFFGDQTFWMRPFGSWINQSNSGGAPGYSATVGGVALGADGAPSDTARVGLSFAYANADVTSNSAVAPNSDGINLYQLMAYGSLALDSVTTVDYQLDGGTDANSGERRIIFVGKSADADYNTYTAHAGFGINRSFTLAPQDTLTTSLRVDYTHLHDPGYTETGAGVLDLNVAPNSTEQLLWSAELKNAYTLEDGITLLAHAGVGYDSFNRQASTVAAFAGAPDLAFTTYGITTSPWLAQGGVGLEKQFGNGWTVAAHYDGELRTGFNDQSVSLNVRWLF